MHDFLVAHTVKSLPAMRETWIQSLGRGDPLGKEMATHPSILAWKIPWMEEPGGLQSMRSQRVGHDRGTNTHRENTQPDTELSLFVHWYLIKFHRVLGEVEKNSSIVLPGKGEHSRLLPSKPRVPTWRRYCEVLYKLSKECNHLMDVFSNGLVVR